MKRLSYRLFVLVLGLGFSVFCYAEPKPHLPVEHWKTSHGTQVYFVSVDAPDLPMLDITVTFAAGSARDGKSLGVASLTNNLMMQGSEGFTADQIAEKFEYLGVQVDMDVDRDKAILSLRTLTDPKLLKPALNLFAHVLAHPSFTLKDFQRQQSNTLIAIKRQLQEPSSVADIDFFQAVYNGDAYGHPVLGTAATVKKLTPQTVQQFYQQYYVAKNAVITLVGAMSKTKAKAIAEQLSVDLKPGKKSARLSKVPTHNQAKPLVKSFPTPQTYIRMGQLGLNYHDRDYFSLYVGNYILGGGGLVSRLFDEVREKRGLSYGVRSYFYPLDATGPFYISLATRNDQTEQAVNVVRSTLKQFIADGPTAKELKEAKQNIISGYPLRFSSNKKINAYLVRLGFYDLPLDYYEQYPKKVKAVTLAQIQSAFQRRIHAEKLVTVIVGKQ